MYLIASPPEVGTFIVPAIIIDGRWAAGVMSAESRDGELIFNCELTRYIWPAGRD